LGLTTGPPLNLVGRPKDQGVVNVAGRDRAERVEATFKACSDPKIGTGATEGPINPAKHTARIDGGVLGGEVMRVAGSYGLAPVLGQCPGVGATGITLGGGLGWLSGLHGASCDNLLSARIVTADGRILSVNAEHNPDLFC
jgi:FAD/FMN-containing dehydrogenase